MGFENPGQLANMIAGHAAAAASPKTPTHLVVHLKRLAARNPKKLIAPQGDPSAPAASVMTGKPNNPGMGMTQPAVSIGPKQRSRAQLGAIFAKANPLKKSY